MAPDAAARPLSRRIKLEDHPPLVTLADALGYMVALSDEIAQHGAWRRAGALALDARAEPTRDRMAALTRQIEHALFMTRRRQSAQSVIARVPADGPQTAGRLRRSAHDGTLAPAMSSEFDTAMMSAHQKNIVRYQGVLEGALTADERRFVERRVAEEQAALWRILRKSPQSFAVAAAGR